MQPESLNHGTSVRQARLDDHMTTIRLESPIFDEWLCRP